jgi:Pyruvate/2-oxoacid:ferredoxin oxidoreductase delta subunit
VTPVLTPAAPVAVVTGRCQGCGACLLTCPERAIRPAERGDRRLVVLAGRCTGCGECVEVCPVDAIELASGPGTRSEGRAVPEGEAEQ